MFPVPIKVQVVEIQKAEEHMPQSCGIRQHRATEPHSNPQTHMNPCEWSRDHAHHLDIMKQVEDNVMETLLNLSEQVKQMSISSPLEDTVQGMSTLLRLMQHTREVSFVRGSVVIIVTCPTLEGLDDLWVMYTSGELLDMVQSSFVTEDLLRRFGLAEVVLEVAVSGDDYKGCRVELMQDQADGRERHLHDVICPDAMTGWCNFV